MDYFVVAASAKLVAAIITYPHEVISSLISKSPLKMKDFITFLFLNYRLFELVFVNLLLKMEQEDMYQSKILVN